MNLSTQSKEAGRSRSWLIVEDALRDRKGHWSEYIGTFFRGLPAIGDRVDILADADAELWLVQELQAKPVLPPSIWHRMGEGGKVRSLLRVPQHAFATYRAMSVYLKRNPPGDIIFVPTVAHHHLLAWFLLINGPLRRNPARIVLFFMATPVSLDGRTGRPKWHKNPTVLLWKWLLRAIRPAVARKQVFLAAETRELSAALRQLSGIDFHYLPQPVHLPVNAGSDPLKRPLLMGTYGPARHEKGSDVQQNAIKYYLQNFPKGEANFIMHWVGDFNDDRGERVSIDPALAQNERITYLRKYIDSAEYSARLAETDVILVPYRDSYRLRGSRVIIEAMINGIPVIVTRGTALAAQAEEYGACVLCEDGSVESLARAIQQMEINFPQLKVLALERAPLAAAYFSVKNFRKMLLESF